MTAKEKLYSKINKQQHICVGLDTDINKIPKFLRKSPTAILDFNKIIIDNTYENSAAYKINLAFYEKYWEEGLKIVDQTIDYIPDDILIIGDAKRGDIGNTSKMYAEALFDEANFDAVTLHPYMGYDSIGPFLEYSEKLSFILALTSNKSSLDFEKLKLETGLYLYQKVISKVNEWNINDNCGLVFGATNTAELVKNIEGFGNLPVLLPGVGAQGGSLKDVVSTFRNHNNPNYIINISRGLLYVDDSKDFGRSTKKVLEEYNEQIFFLYK